MSINRFKWTVNNTISLGDKEIISWVDTIWSPSWPEGTSKDELLEEIIKGIRNKPCIDDSPLNS